MKNNKFDCFHHQRCFEAHLCSMFYLSFTVPKPSIFSMSHVTLCINYDDWLVKLSQRYTKQVCLEDLEYMVTSLIDCFNDSQ